MRFYLPLNVQLPNDFFAQAVVVTKGLEQRERVKARLEKALASEFPSVVGRVYPLELGPPVGLAAAVPRERARAGPGARHRLQGRQDMLGADPDAANVNYNWIEPARTIRIRVDQDQARLLGLSSQELAQSLNTVVSGVTATQLRSGIYLVDVVVRASAEQRMSLSTIRTLQVPLPNGRTVPLSQIATVEYGQEYPHRLAARPAAHRDRAGRRRARHAGRHGRAGAGAEDRGAERQPAARLPHRRRRHGRGERQGRRSRSRPCVPLMLVLMLTVLMIQLQSFSRLFLVLSVAPLGLIGVVAALLIADKPLGFVAILGVLALIGMIARNSVILIDQIEHERAQGRDAWEAVIEATMHRFRPILLTAAAAILGMIPIAPDDVLGSDGLRHHGWARGRDRADAGLPAGALRDLVPRRAAAGAARIGAGGNMSVDADCHPEPGFRAPGRPDRRRRLARRRRLQPARQERIQRVANEVTRRETIYADFLENASKMLLSAYTHDDDRAGRRRAASDRADQPDEAVRAASHRWRGGSRAQSHRRDPAEAQYRAAPAGARIVVQESRSRPLSEVQPELPGRPGLCAPHLEVKPMNDIQSSDRGLPSRLLRRRSL